MTQDQLEGFIAVARRNPDGMGPKTTMVVRLADERDAAIRQRDRALALLREFADFHPVYDPPPSAAQKAARELLAEVGE